MVPLPSVAPEQVWQPCCEHAEAVVGVGGGCGVVVAGRSIGTTEDLVLVTHAILVGIVVDGGSAAVSLTRAGLAPCCEHAEAVVGVGGRRCVVVAGRSIGAAVQLVIITHAILVGIVVDGGSDPSVSPEQVWQPVANTQRLLSVSVVDVAS